jgi:hypothetical protein
MRRRFSRVTVLAGIILLCALAGVTACSKVHVPSVDLNAFSVWIGIAEPPAPPPVAVDIVCDPTDGAPCTSDLLRAQLHAVLVATAGRPGSFVRAWVLGTDITGLQLIAIQTSPALTSTHSARATALARERFVATADVYFAKAFESVFDRPAPRRSLLAESMTRVAWADVPPNMQRILICLTDGREYSHFADMECRPIPNPEAFTAAVQREHVLGPGSLHGTVIALAGFDLTPMHDRPCPVTIAKADEIRTVWRHVLLHAGASSVTFHTGIADPDQLLSSKEAR